MKSHVKRIIFAVSGIVLLGGGWLVWQTQLHDPQMLSMPVAEASINPSPSAVSTASPEALVDRIIQLSGLQKQIEQISEKLLEDIHQSPDKPNDPVLVEAIEQIVSEAYKPEFFLQQLRTTLKQSFSTTQLETLVRMYNTPLMQKITAIENRELDLVAFEAFIENVVQTSLPANRLHLLQELESVTHATEFVVELMISTRRALLMGMVDGAAETMNSFDASIEAQKIEIRDNTYQSVILIMAYSYQELTDLELDEYIQFYETVEGEWFITQSVNTLIEAFHMGSLETGRRIAELTAQQQACTSSQALNTMAEETINEKPCTNDVHSMNGHDEADADTAVEADADKAAGETNADADAAKNADTNISAGASASPGTSHNTQANTKPAIETETKKLAGLPVGDARECLDLNDNQAIALCAERFR